MKNFLFFLKSDLKRATLWLAAAVTCGAIVFGYTSAGFEDIRPYAVCTEDSSAEAEALVNYLAGYDFLVCGSREELVGAVRSGQADSGVIIREGFSEALAAGKMSRCMELVASDRSTKQALCKIVAAYSSYQAYVPYIAAEEAEDFGYDTDAAGIASYRDKLPEEVKRLGFEMVSVRGENVEAAENDDLPTGIAAILCFLMQGFLAAGYVRRRGRPVRIRFRTRGSYFFRYLLPSCASLGILLYASALLGLFLAARISSAVILPMAAALGIYMFLLAWLFSALCLLPVSDYILVCAVAVDAAASLVLCPLYSGTNLALGILAPLRALSVPYLLYLLL